MTLSTSDPSGTVIPPHPGELSIGGTWVPAASDETIRVVSPVTEQVIAEVAAPSTADADRAVTAARRAFDEGPWPRMSPADRASVVSRLCDAFEKRMADLDLAWAVESGAPLTHCEMMNGGAASSVWRHAVAIAPGLAWEEDRGDALVRREPTGPVLAILTYNGPVVLMGMKVVPALLAGCPVVVKHAPESQLTSRILAEAAHDAELPEGVLSFLAADTDVTRYLVGHPGIDLVTVTGGTAIGIDIAKTTADRLARTVLELGGKSPAILCDDVDMDPVMESLAEGASSFLGQICVSLSRVLVSRARYDEVVGRLADYYSGLRLGDPLDRSVQRGPLAVERARTRAEAAVETAREQGARVVVGGKRPTHLDRGWFYEPTLLADVTNDMTVAQEEIFAPVTTVIAYDDLDDAVRIANGTPFGLAASVYSGSTEAALDIARRIRSGTVAVNTAGMSLTQPFGGVRASGWGRECGAEGILEFTDIKQVLVAGGASFLQG
jgi:aldehyde dehydrogenase (NAD+)